MSYIKISLTLTILMSVLFCRSVFADGAVQGVIKSSDQVFEGYTLFAKMGSGTTYLIDNYGRILNTWESEHNPYLSVYLLENGNIVRPYLTDANISGVQIFTWDGELIWDFVYYADLYFNHHDVEPLPNGNILLVSRDNHSKAELIAAGRDPASISTLRIALDKIVEIKPTGFNTGDVVWEWKPYDHLIQDFDPLKNNYGVVENHPELLDVNYTPFATLDWLHCNAVDYNSEFDQILVDARNVYEFWIIDHSTTTAEAAGHTGGTYGKGGDFLYRWGNPQAYRAVTNNEQKLFQQHDARWVDEGCPGEGNITVYNNGVDRPGGEYSTVEEVVLPVDANGNYTAPVPGNSYEPVDAVWTYADTPPDSMYSEIISGAHRLPNGNTLICVGEDGRFVEVQPDKTVVWEYIYPTTTFKSIFRCFKYALDYLPFTENELIPKGYIEQYQILYEGTQNSPKRPADLNQVTITSKIYSTNGISDVELHAFYGNDSLIVSMYDNGLGNDLIPGDSVYTAVIPALFGIDQVDYYIHATDNTAFSFNDPPYATEDYTFKYSITSSTPQNIKISRDADLIQIDWDPIDGISSYIIYSSNDPYTGFEIDTTGDFDGESWSTSIVDAKKFYYVRATDSK